MATIRDTQGHVALDRIDVWFQDEARFGQQNTTTRIWAKKGTPPRAVRQQQFESAYLYGAVCPATGATEAIIAQHVNSEDMYQHLKLTSAATTFGRHALIIMDGADCPQTASLLTPIEQVKQWLRQNMLANRCFSGYDDIVEQCSIAWNSFIENKERVSKLCSRRWAILTD
ncbi:Uncharacterised protein [Shewanella morhuae]|uniref:Tc1-like transposase DDE domain-containing protein n=1 Tax=Shewanella morhuae TaxID=365591 RepID=A0A380AMF4_9GAMM|nr:Uncharacterised protein [Shewanella morhuae]